MRPARPVPPRARVLMLTIFAASFGWLEAVVVVYIRALLGIGRTETIPPAAEVMHRIGTLPWLLPTEQTREIATMLILASIAWLTARTWRRRVGAFLFCFGVWDIMYYVALYALLHWPPSLGTMDLLFLIPPHPWWYQPVWLPVLISCGFVAAGLALIRVGPRRRRLQIPSG
jgi:hypothetical protein